MRKSPVRHHVRQHTRGGHRVNSYWRGYGKSNPHTRRRKITRRTTTHPYLAQYPPKQQKILMEAEEYITEKFTITNPERFWSYIEQMEEIPDEVWEEDAGEIARIIMENRKYHNFLIKYLKPKDNPGHNPEIKPLVSPVTGAPLEAPTPGATVLRDPYGGMYYRVPNGRMITPEHQRVQQAKNILRQEVQQANQYIKRGDIAGAVKRIAWANNTLALSVPPHIRQVDPTIRKFKQAHTVIHNAWFSSPRDEERIRKEVKDLAEII